MPCNHKFFGHPLHLVGQNGLLPNWEAETLIIGTFNPSNEWVPDNQADYFYGRSNFFWKVLPVFACEEVINNNNVIEQIDFLQRNRIAITDLLISIDDADIDNLQHIDWIGNYLDNNFANFNGLTWNLLNIFQYIQDKNISAVYFTKLGNNPPFGAQISAIENYCDQHAIINHRLHTPTGQGLGNGVPRRNKLIERWFIQGGNEFPFLCPEFDINNFPWE
jgi:hypothetical protein